MPPEESACATPPPRPQCSRRTRLHNRILSVLFRTSFTFMLHAEDSGRGKAGFSCIPGCPWALMELRTHEETAHSSTIHQAEWTPWRPPRRTELFRTLESFGSSRNTGRKFSKNKIML